MLLPRWALPFSTNRESGHFLKGSSCIPSIPSAVSYVPRHHWAHLIGSMAILGTDWLEVPIPYIFGLYISGLNFGEYPHNSYGLIKYGTFTYLHWLSHRIHVCYIYGNMDPINIPQMLAYIYHIYIYTIHGSIDYWWLATAWEARPGYHGSQDPRMMWRPQKSLPLNPPGATRRGGLKGAVWDTPEKLGTWSLDVFGKWFWGKWGCFFWKRWGFSMIFDHFGWQRHILCEVSVANLLGF